MKHKLYVLICILSVTLFSDITAAERKKKKDEEKTSAKKENAYDKLFDKKSHIKAEGLITLHKVDGKLYFEFPLNLLNKDMLIASTITETSDNGDGLVGQKPMDPIHVQFTKIDSTIQLRLIDGLSITTKEGNDNIERALAKSNIGSILGNYKVLAYNADSSAVVFETTEFFAGDNKQLDVIDPYGANTYGGYLNRQSTFQSDKSFLEGIKAFKDNVAIRSVLSYKCTIIYGRSYIEYEKPLTILATRSIILLPETPARPRIADPRIGIFPTGKIKYTNKDNRAKVVYFSNRWKLEPSDEATFKAGKLVEPKKPIVFYIDNNFPEMWKKYISMGIEDWNLAFEKIGFKNAVQTRPFPTDDPEFDPDNIKYSCVRYAPTPMANAMGPSWTDPRSGEIINASVYIYHNLINLLYSWRFIHTAAADPDVRVKILPESIMGDAIRYVARHEVGHCLGFMHNMAASDAYPVEKLRDPEFTQANGTTPSIMDYARFNYVAQPGDKEKGVKLTPPILGAYDYYLVKWNYSYLPETKTAEEESEILTRWISEKAGDPIYRYGKQQLSLILDPTSLSEALGDDAVKASEYGIKNLKYILSNLNTWFDANDKDYTHRGMLYNEILQQYGRYLNHVFFNIGGIYLNEKYVGDPRPSYQSVPKEKQKQALKFLMTQAKEIEWVENKELLKNFPLIGSPAYDIQSSLVSQIINSGSGKIPLCVTKSTPEEAYTTKEYLNDVYNYVWENTLKNKSLSVSDRKLQIAFVDAVVNKGTSTQSKNSIMIGITDNSIQMPDYVQQKSIKDFGYNTQYAFERLQSPEEVSGFGFLFNVNFNNAPEQYHVYYGILMKTKDLLQKNYNHPNIETRNHYRLLLRQIEKALK